MKRNLTILSLSVLFSLGKTFAQTYVPVPATGYTLDAVAENTTAAATTNTCIDGSDYVLYSQYYGSLYSASAAGLPNNGVITSGTRSYQLQNYTGPNMLYLIALQRDSLTLVNPAPFPALSLLGFATEGAGTMSVIVRFSDNTSQAFTNLALADWFTTGGTVVANGFDRAGRTSGTIGNSAPNPRMFATDLAISCANQNKYVTRIVVQNTNTNSRICLMALSGNLPAYSVTASTLAICTGSNVTLNATGMTSYTWQAVGSFAGSNSNTINVTPTSSTSYTLDGMSTNGCPGRTIVPINVASGPPIISFAGSTSTVCLGGPASITASGGVSYTLSNGAANGNTFTPSATANYTVSAINGCGTSSAVTTVSVLPLPILASASSTIVCASRPTTLTAGGATTYTWLPGPSTSSNYIVSPATNITYTVTGKLGFCLGTNTIAIATRTNPIISIAASNATICQNGSAVLTATGAVTYTWSPGGSNGPGLTVTPTISTLYHVDGTGSNGCVISVPQVIVVVSNPTINATASDDVVCVNGTSTLTATGGNTYVWSDNTTATTSVVNPTVTTTYTVTGTSAAGCSSSVALVVTVFDPTLTITSSTAICKGTNISLSASGMDSFLWSTGSVFSSINVTPIATTTYSVEGSSSLGIITCSASAAVTISVNINPTVTAAASPSNICKGQNSVIDAGGASTYTWAAPSSTVAPSLTVTPSADQTYTVTGTDVNGCTGSRTVLVKVTGCVGIATNALNTSNMLVYPNPSNGIVNIQADVNMDLTVINELGQPVRSLKLNDANSRQVTVDGLAAGIYFVISTDRSLSVKQKIVITK